MDANKRLNELFDRAKEQPSTVSIETTKTKFIEQISSFGGKQVHHNKINFTSFKTISIMITTIAVASVGVLVLFYNTEELSNDYENISSIEITTKDVKVEAIEKVRSKTIENIQLTEETNREFIYKTPSRTIELNIIKDDSSFVKESEKNSEYEFPVLTEEEKKENNKRKKGMIKQLLRPGKSYVYVPSGSFESNNDKISVQAFYMKATEVTNEEYRTFLFDLLIQGKKEEFLLAKPNQKGWNKLGKWGEPMEVNYFSHPAYNEYPVNNVSKKGAEMFCKWLTQEVNSSPKNKTYINDLRLPSEMEWEYAASGGGKQKPYPWGGPYLRNSNGCFLANFKTGMDTTKKEVDVPKVGKTYTYAGSENSLYIADGGFFTVKSTSYNPNEFGLYCMSGNLAEMVLNKEGKMITKGGSWNSIGYYLQIENHEEVDINLGDLQTGFRPVLTFLGKE